MKNWNNTPAGSELDEHVAKALGLETDTDFYGNLCIVSGEDWEDWHFIDPYSTASSLVIPLPEGHHWVLALNDKGWRAWIVDRSQYDIVAILSSPAHGHGETIPLACSRAFLNWKELSATLAAELASAWSDLLQGA